MRVACPVRASSYEPCAWAGGRTPRISAAIYPPAGPPPFPRDTAGRARGRRPGISKALLDISGTIEFAGRDKDMVASYPQARVQARAGLGFAACARWLPPPQATPAALPHIFLRRPCTHHTAGWKRRDRLVAATARDARLVPALSSSQTPAQWGSMAGFVGAF